MEYEGQICRGPMERASFMLPISVGCSYNQCRFCMLFKHLTYRELPMEQIEAELQRVRSVGGNPKQVFLGDGNAFSARTDRLLAILDRVHQAFPACESVHMDATIHDILRKPAQELEALSAAGVRTLYLGIECALDDVLAQMNKGQTVAQAEEAIEKLHQAGMRYGAHMMTGICGKGRGLENAQALAEFYNRTRPDRIVNFSLFLHRRAPLYQDILAGRFVPADELENLREERRLLELLETDGLSYDGFHDFLPFRVRGLLPRDKEKMLQKLDEAIETYAEQEPAVAFVE
ncbi:radical SAM protein [Flavonifractor sp. An92]|uniref:radical SAM protein n=1 Tax=Flavonifractor sp. An92 TaxID=1965666 RepID=UPI000B3AF41D|nr:radical SAM protein [Flavonifractor sp. An92]OUN05411.1 radical SAM protein [Flavonifractor sp. An92]